MKRFLGACALAALLGASARGGTLFTTPVMVVTPMTLKMGAADPHRSFTNTFLVENVGSGTLVGKVKVKPPFKILDGESYKIRQNEAQVVTIAYIPKDSKTVTNTVEFSGGGGCKATVIGKPSK